MLTYLQLPPLEDRRRQLRLTMLYKIAGDLVPAIPSKNFLRPADPTKRKVRPTKYEDFISKNPLQRQVHNNSRAFVIPPTRTEQYKGSFFVRTPLEWNQLDNAIVQQQTANAFCSALCRVGPAVFQN